MQARLWRVVALAGLAAAALYTPTGWAGYQTCNGRVVADSVSRCPDGSIPIYQSGSPPSSVPSPSPSGESRRLVPVAGETAHRIGLSCRNLRCETREGMQAGLATLEITGQQPDRAGSSLNMVIGDLASEREIERRKVGVFSDGHYTASVALYRLPPGDYGVGFTAPGDDRNFLGVAHFTLGGTKPAPDPRPAPPSTNEGLLGEWYGSNVAGSFTLRANGSYDSPNGASGRWHAEGRDVVFVSGPLTAWNQGRATLSGNGALEFYWTTPQGAKQYFAFVKRD